MKTMLVLLVATLCGCRLSWDIPVVPKTDRCTGKTSSSYVYNAACDEPTKPIKIDGEPYRR